VSGHGEKQSRQKEAAIIALLACPTIAAAAAQTGVASATLRRWLQDPAFSAEYRAARRQVVEHTVSQLQRSAAEAVTALRDHLDCGIPAVEIAAAKTILDYTFKGLEVLDLAAEVAELKASLQAARNGDPA